jgi:hypothetical protein
VSDTAAVQLARVLELVDGLRTKSAFAQDEGLDDVAMAFRQSADLIEWAIEGDTARVEFELSEMWWENP